MSDTADSVAVVLEFLRRNRFSKAEAALRGELNSLSDCSDFIQQHDDVNATTLNNSSSQSRDSSTEFIVKEIDAMPVGNGEDNEKGIESNNSSCSQDNLDSFWLKNDHLSKHSCVKTAFPFKLDNESSIGKEITMKAEKCEGLTDPKSSISFDMPLTGANCREELPRLPRVRIKSEEKLVNMQWEEPEANGTGTFMIGSYLDVPIGQEISFSGGKHAILSVSQGIAVDTTDFMSGFATVGDDPFDYPNESWDSDEYDDDDDIGYTLQPVEDESWFLAHEIDYPNNTKKGTSQGNIQDRLDLVSRKDGDEHSFAEEDTYLSGEQYFQAKSVKQTAARALMDRNMYGKLDEKNQTTQYDGQLMDLEELNLMQAEPVWQGFVNQNNELLVFDNGNVINDGEQPCREYPFLGDDQHSLARSIGVGISSDAADIGSELRESLVGESSEKDIVSLPDCHVGVSDARSSQYNASSSSNWLKSDQTRNKKNHAISASEETRPLVDGGFSFAPLARSGDGLKSGADEKLWSDMASNAFGDDAYESQVGTENMLATIDLSSMRSSKDEKASDADKSGNSSASSALNYDYTDVKKVRHFRSNGLKEDHGTSLEDEEAAALQEQVQQIKAQEEEFETFNLKIVHRKNRTGFEEDKNFHVVPNSIIAGRYNVTEYLGSAAFSKAIQARDLHTGMDVCMKIIKNNKDFFDQSLDEIKLLKFINKNDPSDKYHILRLYDYFYYREHLLIVCELLKANLYEFHKFNRESGGEVYFTMPRFQSITVQILEALQFLHGLGLIHCDLKPENILVKSYSRCEVKVIDLGSSCFETDHLCSYVQSRSYRAPEVILGLPYGTKIDIWSLGCILAELCSGNVLFQNDSSASLLARVVGIIGHIDREMLAKGRDTYKYFTKTHMLYERNQETNRLQYLIPKKTSLRHRLRMGDQGFIDFVAHLLEVNPKKRPSASEALKHPWIAYPYEPISP